jgi:hypothetical protein
MEEALQQAAAAAAAASGVGKTAADIYSCCRL